MNSRQYHVTVRVRFVTDPEDWWVDLVVLTSADCPMEARTKARDLVLREWGSAEVLRIEPEEGPQ